MAFWTTTEIRKLDELYPVASRDQIVAEIPKHNWNAIIGRAQMRGLKRPLIRQKDSSDPLISVLVARRKELGLSQLGLARRLGIYHSVLNRLEHDKTKPGLRVLRRWCAALGLELSVSAKPNGVSH